MGNDRSPDNGLPAGSAFGLTRRRLVQGAFAAGGIGGMVAASTRAVFGQERDRDPIALQLARVLNKTSFNDLPPVVIKHAKVILASTFASAASGLAIGSARIERELAKEHGGKPEAPLWFDGARLPVTDAARANAMLSDSSASDDSDLRNVAHDGTCLTAVGLALTERMGASGQDTLAAMVAGYEAAGRVGEALSASADTARGSGAASGNVGRGFHASSIVAFGGTVAAAKLLRLTDEQMAQAIGITATTVGGLSIGTNSWAREYHAGNAALCAVNAALAAGRGYTVNPDMLEASGGFLAVFSGAKPVTTSLTRETGTDYQIARYLAIKLVPGAHAFHPAVEAALNAARESRVPAEDVAKILVAGPQSRQVTSKPPKDMIEAIHSLSYFLASAVADKDFSWKHAEPEMIQRPIIARLMGLVERDPSPSTVHYDWGWGATVTIVTKSGARFASTVDAPKGSAPRGIEWSDVDAKFNALMPQSKLPASRIQKSLELIHDFDKVKKVSQLTSLLS
ncbi:MAG TPA: MmgE/PrpD family protein [Bryobacteraceae bacterium]|nr:MmgE/PrpD family protein [Bryobacteraceae bacterium]